MAELSSTNYSENDAGNNAQPPNGMPENQAPSTINDAWRTGMASVKKSYDRDHAGTWAVVSGSANAIVVTYVVPPLSYMQGEKFAFKAISANTSATTLQINSLAIQNILKKSSTGAIPCVGGEIQVGDIVEVEYDGTQFQILNPASSNVVQVGNGGTGLTDGSNLVQTGTGLDWWGSTLPTGFLWCDGSTASRTTYANLFAVIGTTYGIGDGSTTFNLPDCRGRVTAAADNMGQGAASRLTLSRSQGVNGNAIGNGGGEQAHTQIVAEIALHSHPVSNIPINNGAIPFFNTNSSGGYSFQSFATNTSNTGSSTPMNVVQPTIVCNKIIKF